MLRTHDVVFRSPVGMSCRRRSRAMGQQPSVFGNFPCFLDRRRFGTDSLRTFVLGPSLFRQLPPYICGCRNDANLCTNPEKTLAPQVCSWDPSITAFGYILPQRPQARIPMANPGCPDLAGGIRTTLPYSSWRFDFGFSIIFSRSSPGFA